MQTGPLKTSMQSAMDETEEVIYAVVEGLLRKTGVHPREVRDAMPCSSNSLKLLGNPISVAC